MGSYPDPSYHDFTVAAKPHIIQPKAAHTHTIILLHGRDSEAAEFASQLFESEGSGTKDQKRTLPDIFPSVRWVFPEAGHLKSARFGENMSQWFDIWSLDDPQENFQLQLPGLRHSIKHIIEVLGVESQKVLMGRIFLGGISQGFSAALAAFMATSRLENVIGIEELPKLAGLIGFSSWMPPVDVLDRLSQPCSPHLHRTLKPVFTPIFLAHSKNDDVVDVKLARHMRNRLDGFATNVKLHQYEDGGHWVNEPEGIDDLVAFLKERGV